MQPLMGTSAETRRKKFLRLAYCCGQEVVANGRIHPQGIIFSSLPVAKFVSLGLLSPTFSKTPIRFGCADEYKHCTVNINGLLCWKPGMILTVLASSVTEFRFDRFHGSWCAESIRR